MPRGKGHTRPNTPKTYIHWHLAMSPDDDARARELCASRNVCLSQLIRDLIADNITYVCDTCYSNPCRCSVAGQL